jgi:drug/metabolite transporter (DMT)-like permease
MIAAAGYVALGRRNRDFPSLWLYVVPIYLQAGLISLVASLPWLGTFEFGSGREWLLMLGLACLPTIIGHSMINYGVRHLRGQVVSLCNVIQFVFAGVLAYFLFPRAPRPALLRRQRRRRRRRRAGGVFRPHAAAGRRVD